MIELHGILKEGTFLLSVEHVTTQSQISLLMSWTGIC